MSEPEGAARKEAEGEKNLKSKTEDSPPLNNASIVKVQPTTASTATTDDAKKATTIQENKTSATNTMDGIENGTSMSQERMTKADATNNSNKTDDATSSSSTTSSSVNLPPANTGNDRVAMDTPKRPLVGDTGTASTQAPAASTATASLSKSNLSAADASKKEAASAVTKTPSTTTSVQKPSSLPAGSSQKTSSWSTGHASSLSESKSFTTSQQQSASGIQTQKVPVGSHSQQIVASVPPPPRKPTVSTASYTAHSPLGFTDEDMSATSESEAVIVRQRAPLADKYDPYIVPSDTSLEDAKSRLRTALDQTRQLRAAFTERVYGKYRICLKPPPQTEDIIETLEQHPEQLLRKLQDEIKYVKAEKELEKKEVQRLHNQAAAAARKESIADAAAPAASNDAGKTAKPSRNQLSDAEQLMCVTTGLGLVVLPESDASNIDMAVYNDRGPLDLNTGLRVRGISQAAATAGEATLERARRAQALKVERDKIREDHPHHPLPHDNFDGNYSKASFAAGAKARKVTPSMSYASTLARATANQKKAPPKVSGAKRPLSPGSSSKASAIDSAASARAIRARVQATMSMNTLLSLNPTHEELRNDTKYSASTMAMMELGVGNQSTQTVQYHKNTPHRFKHPFPDSLGGRRRPVAGTNSASLVLPSTPTIKERKRFQKIPTLSTKDATNSDAQQAIGSILDQFVSPPQEARPTKKKRITEIEFLHGLSSGKSDDTGQAPNFDSTLVLNVMKAVGLVGTSTSDTIVSTSPHDLSTAVSSLFDVEGIRAEGVAVDSGPLFQSLEKMRGLESSVTDSARYSSETRERQPSASPISTSIQQSSTDNSEAPVVQLRGGGGEATTTSSDGKKEAPSISSQVKAGAVNGKASDQNSQTSSSPQKRSSGNLQNKSGNAPAGAFQNVWDDRTQRPMVLLQQPMVAQGQNGQMQQQFQQNNALQLAHQLRMSRMPNQGHPGGGDLTDYIGGLHQQQKAAYDWSAAVASTQSLAALGLNQQQARAFQQQNFAHAAAAQQQAAAMLGGAQGGAHPYGYPHLAGQLLNPAAAAALMGHSGMQRMQSGGQNQTSKNHPPQKEKEGETKPNGTASSNKDNKPGEEKKQSIDSSAGTKRKLSTSSDASKELPASKQGRSSAATDAKSSQPDVNAKTSGAAMDKKRPAIPNESDVKTPSGLQFFVPPTPAEISFEVASKILAGRFHESSKSVQSMPGEEGARLIRFMTSVGTAVPIPKAMVMHRLKDRMNIPILKNNVAGSIPASSREVIIAVIMLWLWRNNEQSFQQAFAKSGRIDVDRDCKWFVDTAVKKAVSALSDQIARESASRSVGPLTSALIAHKTKSAAGKAAPGTDPQSIRAVTTKIDLLVASIVSKSLNMTFTLSSEVDELLPTFHDRIEYLDEARKCALYCKSQERALLAAIVSRKSTMSFSFSHSYVSAMVRAGEALGHGSLFEAVQNEKYGVSTMIPYDVFTDESYAWEDPCRPAMGFTEGLTGDGMMRRAHARAMIQKSLKKLQERHNVRGGTPGPGPYVDQSGSAATTSTARSGSTTPRGGLQRRRSYSELPAHHGSGSAAATSAAVYAPKHACPAFKWEANDSGNTPYGRHSYRTIPRSLSLTQGAAVMRQSGRGGKASRRKSSVRPLDSQSGQPEPSSDEIDPTGRSTREIPWKDVAGIFQRVQLPGRLKEKKDSEAKKVAPRDRTIFAPVVKHTTSTLVIDSGESSEEEDLSDEAVLARHQVVLDEMKIKLTAIQESRKKNLDRRKSRDKTHT